MESLNEVVDHFFPEQPPENAVNLHRPLSGPYTYNKEYFEQLENNLKIINAQIDELEKQS
jgi:hypothetical protein